jgi:hypothetical protein
MKIFGYPVVEYNLFENDRPFFITFGDLSDYIAPLTPEQVENILSKREIVIPAERLEILNYD